MSPEQAATRSLNRHQVMSADFLTGIALGVSLASSFFIILALAIWI